MSDSSRAWAILGLGREATEKDIRRAYAVRLKQIDMSQDVAGFDALRHAYEMALSHARRAVAAAEPPPQSEADVVEERSEPQSSDAAPLAIDAFPDPTVPFQKMEALVQAWDYSIDAWRELLNDPLLDPPEVSAVFEYALVDALCRNELKDAYILSAGVEWQDLLESRYAWVSDGLRFARLFPHYDDLRQALVAVRKPRSAEPPSLSEKLAGLARYKWSLGIIVFLLIQFLLKHVWK